MNMQKWTCKNEHAKTNMQKANMNVTITAILLVLHWRMHPSLSTLANIDIYSSEQLLIDSCRVAMCNATASNWFLSLGKRLVCNATASNSAVWKFASTHDCLETKYGRFEVSYYSGLMLKAMKKPIKTQNSSLLNVTYWLHISTTYCNPFHLILAQCDLLTAHLHNVLPHCKWNSNICFYATTSRKQG